MPPAPPLSAAPVALVSDLLESAAASGASDVHMDPYDEGLRLRIRRDGHLQPYGVAPRHQADAVVARVKVLAGLDLAEKRRPQDGRLSFAHAARTIDVRVSTLPTVHGEKVVMRLLDRNRLPLDFPSLGFDDDASTHIHSALSHPHGLILVTGPTGSGKTTTLYTALRHLSTPERNVLTVEDPVEYHIDGIAQSAARPDIGYTFAAALRAFLRQDPDVVMVGEIRDAETTDVAIRAALTGHLVLSTLHTNDALSSIGRLFDLGAEPYLVASALRLLLAQRLVRRICPTCSTPYTLTPREQTLLSLPSPEAFAGAGCADCGGTGYRGRTALVEVLPVTPMISDAIASQASLNSLRSAATAEGFVPLRTHGSRLVKEGVTSAAEVLRETL